jgi:hypothetical protein
VGLNSVAVSSSGSKSPTFDYLDRYLLRYYSKCPVLHSQLFRIREQLRVSVAVALPKSSEKLKKIKLDTESKLSVNKSTIISTPKAVNKEYRVLSTVSELIRYGYVVDKRPNPKARKRKQKQLSQANI